MIDWLPVDYGETISTALPDATVDELALARLGLRDRVNVVIFAYDHGLVRPA